MMKRSAKRVYQEDPQFLVAEASRDRSAINPHYLAHVKRCFAEGLFVSVATHDEALIDAVVALAKAQHVAPDAFEFQMLLGVCETLRARVHALGFAVRVYVPYGADWYGYSTRRLQENPRITGYILRALIKR
ncbi:proline dehydrogenase family protein [Pantoea phytobeneficialis]|uniref:Proline dehydrogenase family protein n=1 Tax=Pantoea phytobeneficialis TaxID=2052056 RepID=A0ABT8Y276_9GAMM|nr:proline dehydrogenase family protein [Pantoea phytobeneficialis]MDO6409160.1 proline dehydrogenase family protein [Pantoea phytobeneficialis]